MLYLDTSLLVASVTDEPATERVDAWLQELPSADAAISEWVITEFSAALSMKVRTRQVTDDHRHYAIEAFSRMITDTLMLLPVHGHHFRMAARLADRYRPGLRSGDALHLAIASDGPATLCTLDKRLSEAGTALGISTHLL